MFFLKALEGVELFLTASRDRSSENLSFSLLIRNKADTNGL